MKRSLLNFLIILLILNIFSYTSFGENILNKNYKYTSLIAQIPNESGRGSSSGTSSVFSEIQTRITRIFLIIMSFIFTILMILGSGFFIFLGIKYILGIGDIKELHKSLMYLALGIVFLILSFFFPNLLRNFIESFTK